MLQPLLHELDGQPVEQLRMRRRLALRAEVLARRDEARAEVRLPDAVDERPRRRRRLRGRPATARTSAASAARSAGSGCRNAGTPALDRLAGLEEVAALEHVRRARGSSRGLQHELRRALRVLLPQRLDLVVRLLPLRHRRPPVAEDASAICAGVRCSRRDRQDLAHARAAAGRRPASSAVGDATGGSGRGCCSGCRRCSSRRGSASGGTSASRPSANSIGFSSTKTALRG